MEESQGKAAAELPALEMRANNEPLNRLWQGFIVAERWMMIRPL
tara:strand:- start:8060 stop:8191 length:132 start_codon:yes stop_codon:yes gene_type:complete